MSQSPNFAGMGYMESMPRIADQEPIDIQRGTVIAKKYCVGDKIKAGSFATVFFVKTLDEKEYSKVLKISKDNNSNEKYHTEVMILKSLGENCFPQFIEKFNFKQYKCIVMSYSGECVADILKRSPTETFSNPNVLRLTSTLFKSLDYLHQADFVHGDIHGGNLMLKLRNGLLIFNLIDFGNATLAKSTWKMSLNSISTSFNLNMSQKYDPIDDFIGSMYYMSECAGVYLFDEKHGGAIRAKEKFHRDPCKVYNSSQKWMGMVVAKLDQMKKNKSNDLIPIRDIFDAAIPHCNRTSPIEYKIIDKKVYID